eukprot:5397831-Pleurochrysis_carterae.AAC.1
MSPGLRFAGAGKRRRVGCALSAGSAAVAFASAPGGGQEETGTVAGVDADAVAAEDAASADAAQKSWLKCASDQRATFRGVVVSKCAVYEAECRRS